MQQGIRNKSRRKNTAFDLVRMRVAITDAEKQDFCRTKEANCARHAQQIASRWADKSAFRVSQGLM